MKKISLIIFALSLMFAMPVNAEETEIEKGPQTGNLPVEDMIEKTHDSLDSRLTMLGQELDEPGHISLDIDEYLNLFDVYVMGYTGTIIPQGVETDDDHIVCVSWTSGDTMTPVEFEQFILLLNEYCGESYIYYDGKYYWLNNDIWYLELEHNEDGYAAAAWYDRALINALSSESEDTDAVQNTETEELTGTVIMADSVLTSNEIIDPDAVIYPAGQYKIGVDMAAGGYILFQDEGESIGGYCRITKDANGTEVLEGQNFDDIFLVTVSDGLYLQLTRCHAVALDDVQDLDISIPGLFGVGSILAAGEYKVYANSEDKSAYYRIYSDFEENEYATGGNFSNSVYVQVEDGQTLLISRGHIDNPVYVFDSSSPSPDVVNEAVNEEDRTVHAPDTVLNGMIIEATMNTIMVQTDDGSTYLCSTENANFDLASGGIFLGMEVEVTLDKAASDEYGLFIADEVLETGSGTSFFPGTNDAEDLSDQLTDLEKRAEELEPEDFEDSSGFSDISDLRSQIENLESRIESLESKMINFIIKWRH